MTSQTRSANLVEPGGNRVARHRRVRVLASGLVIFLAALTLRLIYLGQIREGPFYNNLRLILDSRYYDMEAQRIAAGDWISQVPFYLGPLYSYCLGVVYLLCGRDFDAARVFQCLLGAGSCLLLYGIGRRVFNPAAGWIAAAIGCLYAPLIFQHGLLLPTSVEVFVNLLFVYLFSNLLRPPSLGRCIGAGVVLGLAAAAKGNAILLLPATIAVMAIMIPVWRKGANDPVGNKNNPMIPHVAARIGALTLGTVLAIAPVTMHNYKAGGKWVLLTTNAGRNLLKGNGPTATGTHAYLPRSQRGTDLSDYLNHPKKIDPKRVAVESGEMAAEAWKYMAEHPGRTARLWAKKLMLMFNTTELGMRDQFYFGCTQASLLQFPLPGFGLVGTLGLTGVVLALPLWRRAAMLYAFLIVQTASFVLIFVLGRYRMPAAMVLAVFSGYTLMWWVDAIRRRSWPRLAGSAALVAGCAFFVHWSLAEFPRERGFAIQYEIVGDFCFDRGRYEDAADAYRSAIGADWQDENVAKKRKKCLQRLGTCHLKLNQLPQARDAYRQLLSELETLGTARSAKTATDVRTMLERIEAGERPDPPNELEESSDDTDGG